MIICTSGIIGSGKDTIADYLANFHEYRRESFAGNLKDAVSSIFGWDRILLEGRTAESRAWREEVDEWWSERLGIPNLTPRWVLQYFATDICRDAFHSDIWIASLENKLRNSKDNIVITDCRFPNEFAAIKAAGGIVIQITRGEAPVWKSDAILAMNGDSGARQRLTSQKVHSSEWAVFTIDFDFTIENNGTIDELYSKVKELVIDARK